MAEEQLQQALQVHRQSLQALEVEMTAVLQSDTQRENTTLRTECKELSERLAVLEQRANELSQHNEQLRSTLHDQLFNERSGIVNSSRQRVELYYRGVAQGEQNRLHALEQQVLQRIKALQGRLQQERAPQQQDLLQQLLSLEQQSRQLFAASRAGYEPAAGAFTADEQAQFEALRQEPLTEEQLRESEKKNNLESFIGQNLINKAGLLLIVIGVIAASQYTLLRLPDVMKGAAMFLLGAVMLTFGELLSRRRANVFSLGLTAGGVAVLYVSLSVSYFVLDILGVYPAIGICLLVTATAFFLSRRYGSQTIATFALIGGYLPLLAVGTSQAMVYGAMAYFVVLNLLALLLASQRRWMLCATVGLGLNLLGTVYLTAAATAGNYGAAFTATSLIPLCYIFFTFLVYIAVTVVGAYRSRKQFATTEMVLLALNTAASALLMYGTFQRVGLGQLTGLLAVAFAVCYLLLGRFVEGWVQPKSRSALFYLTGFAFAVLVVPLQLGRVWLSLGWLVEGVLLACYGTLRRQDQLMRRVGHAIFGLCFGAFVLIDLASWLAYGGTLFPWQYLAITLGSVAIWAAQRRAAQPPSSLRTAFQVAVAVNLWLYLCYLILGPLSDMLYTSLYSYGGWSGYITYCMYSLVIGITVLYAYALRHIKQFAEPALHVLSTVLSVVAFLGVLWANLDARFFVQFDTELGMGIVVVGTVALLVSNLAAVFGMRELLLHQVLARRANLQLYPLLLSCVGLLLMSQVLVSSYQLELSSVYLSLLYMGAAVALVVGGFVKRYPYLRRFGLGLSIMAVAKLFLVDLFSLTEGFRIVSYFALGIALIAISFVYTYFSKRFERLEEVAVNE